MLAGSRDSCTVTASGTKIRVKMESNNHQTVTPAVKWGMCEVTDYVIANGV